MQTILKAKSFVPPQISRNDHTDYRYLLSTRSLQRDTHRRDIRIREPIHIPRLLLVVG